MTLHVDIAVEVDVKDRVNVHVAVNLEVEVDVEVLVEVHDPVATGTGRLLDTLEVPRHRAADLRAPARCPERGESCRPEDSVLW